jgi:uncharacterized membrane protein YjgN (DUF898 family)
VENPAVRGIDVATAVPATASTASVARFEFTGTGAEYFRIWIVNLLLTIVTLGVFSAWAKVRRLRYFYGNTQLAGSSFEYHGEAAKILKGRMIAAAFLVPYFVLSQLNPVWSLPFVALFLVALPFLVVKSRQFQTRMTSWRNIRFNFTGTYGQAAKVFLGIALLVPVTLGLILPYWMYARHRFALGRMRFGTADFNFDARAGRYYVAYLVALGLLVALIIAFVIIVAVSGGVAVLTGATAGGRPSPTVAILVGVLVGGLTMASYLLIFAVVQARTNNAGLSGLSVAGHQLTCELSAFKLTGLYLSNAVLTLLTLGLYLPWATVRLHCYQLACLSLTTSGDLDSFAADELRDTSATGEEVGDLLDVDFGL